MLQNFGFLGLKETKKNEKFTKIWRPRPIFTKFDFWHYLELVHLSTKFELDTLKFARVGKFGAIFQKSKSQTIWQPKSTLAKLNTEVFRRVYYICVQF